MNVYGEVYYQGNKEEVVINHSSSAIFFNVEEKVRDITIRGIVNDIGKTTTLKEGERYREMYTKQAGFLADKGSNEEERFMELFLEGDGFPPGYYVVQGITDFTMGSQRLNIEAEIDFKVVEYPVGKDVPL